MGVCITIERLILKNECWLVTRDEEESQNGKVVLLVLFSWALGGGFVDFLAKRNHANKNR
jgi:hypothetical protein